MSRDRSELSLFEKSEQNLCSFIIVSLIMSQTRAPYQFSWDQIKDDKERENYLGECMFTRFNLLIINLI